jgi:uncharacterized paraquat-inducible protein A
MTLAEISKTVNIAQTDAIIITARIIIITTIIIAIAHITLTSFALVVIFIGMTLAEASRIYFKLVLEQIKHAVMVNVYTNSPHPLLFRNT